MFVFHSNGSMAILLLYVDDILLIAFMPSLLCFIISLLKAKFLMTNSGCVSYFLGIATQFNSDGLFLSQIKYVYDLLEKNGMVDYKAISIPLTPKHKLQVNNYPLCSNASLYRSLVGAL